MFTQHFNHYAGPGDSITCEIGGFTIRAQIVHDPDTRPHSYDCYSPEQVRAWEKNQWFFAGLVLSVSKNGVTLSESAASLWGIEHFIGERNTYLLEAANDLLPDAIAKGRSILAKLLAD